MTDSSVFCFVILHLKKIISLFFCSLNLLLFYAEITFSITFLCVCFFIITLFSLTKFRFYQQLKLENKFKSYKLRHKTTKISRLVVQAEPMMHQSYFLNPAAAALTSSQVPNPNKAFQKFANLSPTSIQAPWPRQSRASTRSQSSPS